MRIDKTECPYTFSFFEMSKKYKKYTRAEKHHVNEVHIKGMTNSVFDYAQRYCKWNDIVEEDGIKRLEKFKQFNFRCTENFYNKFNVIVPSVPFAEMAASNMEKLIDSVKDDGYYSVFGNIGGMMILPDFEVSYSIVEDGAYFDLYSRKNERDGSLYMFGKECFEFKTLCLENNLTKAMALAIAILLLMKFGDVETLYVSAGVSRPSLDGDGSISNKAPFPITQIDSSWLRTIVRTEGFMVRGHFRMQPCGEGRLDRKLIYIQPFEKHGYTRTAKKLIQE